ncbi:hypothetical protein LWI29_017506 [Acer saccharum]|uniref:Uncharacterized protein n=1 Tax=Acer saccharum TaxID=4024 RepID=A0AA39SU34_ACESA|nr:hypothetical protein LWI29_017506 [Acer saccharum]KAK1558795.1 hypothetical protein Q3G72_006720 [Acer saccharum]
MSDLHNQSEEMDVEIQRGGVRSTPIKGDQHRSPLVVEEFHADNDDLLRLEETFQPLQEEPPPAEFEYAEKLFVSKPKDNQYTYSAAQQIWEAVCANDKKALYCHIVNSEADVNAMHECLTGNSSDRSSSSSLNLRHELLLLNYFFQGEPIHML